MNASARILIVEDEAFQLNYLKSVFEQVFGNVVCADSGAKAIEALDRAFAEKTYFTFLFLDVGLPDTTGHKILELLRQHEAEHGLPHDKRCRVVMQTAFGDLKNSAGAFSADCDYYLVKPYSKKQIEELLAKLSSALE